MIGYISTKELNDDEDENAQPTKKPPIFYRLQDPPRINTHVFSLELRKVKILSLLCSKE